MTLTKISIIKSKRKSRLLSLIVIAVVATSVAASTPAGFGLSTPFASRAARLGFIAHASVDADYADGEVICAVKDDTRGARDVASRHNLKILEDLEDGCYRMGLAQSISVKQAVTELIADSNVASAEPNYLLRVVEVDQRSVAEVDQRSVAEVDGLGPANYVHQDAVALIRAREAQIFANGGGVTVAVVDTGIDFGHPSLKQAFTGRDFVDNDNDASEVPGGVAYGHGSMVAGIVALVAPHARIMGVRAFDANGMGKVSDVANGIRYAAKKGADVIHMSFGVGTGSSPIRAAVAFAYRKGAIMIVSTGNNNTSIAQYPASDERVMAVAATDQHDIKADFSDYGDYIDVCAPGVGIYSTYPGGRFAWWSGTSFAAAFVSGGAALVLSAGRGNVEGIIARTAVNIDALNPRYARLLGSGRIDALAAVR